jgi:hypothetical protein
MRVVLTAIVWIGALACGLSARGEIYRDPNLHFSLELPEGWQIMPSARLDLINSALPKRASQYGVRYYQGLMPKGAAFDSGPYVLMQWFPGKLNGLSYEQIEREFEVESKGWVEKAEEAMPDLGSDLSFGKPVLDRTKNRIILTMQMDVADVGSVRGVGFGFFCAQGTVYLHCYDLESDFQERAPLFKAMAESLKFDPGYEFKPGPSGLFDSGRVLLIALVVGGALVGLAACGMFKSQPQHRSPDAARA